jgi:hypothetical protein
MQDGTKALQSLADERKSAIDQLRRVLDLTNGQVRAAFEILGDDEVSTEQLATKLISLAQQYKDLQETIREYQRLLNAGGAFKGPAGGALVSEKSIRAAEELLQKGELRSAREILGIPSFDEAGFIRGIKGSWIMSENPSAQGKIFVYGQVLNGVLVDLKYVIQVKSNGSWTIYQPI